MNTVNNVTQLLEEKEDVEKLSERPELEIETTVETCNENDDLIFVKNQQFQFSFIPLTVNLKKQICQNLNIPFINDETSNKVECSRMNISKPRIVKEITGDGNCFFRAISFSLTNSEAFHNVIRNAVCVHMMENGEMFKRYLNSDQSIENYLSSTRMTEEGIWATEVEIFVTAHLLNVDILTFSRGRWLRFAVDELDPSLRIRTEAIYLNHQQNHYNIVLSVNGEESEWTRMQQCKNSNDYEMRYRNRTRMQDLRQKTKEVPKESSENENRKQSLRRRYQDDTEFREQKLKTASIKYLDDDVFQSNLKLNSRKRYHDDLEYQINTKKRSRMVSKDKYTTDPDHREKLKKMNVEKYTSNESYRENVKRRRRERYVTDSQHRDAVKMRNVQKYNTNAEHRNIVKRKRKVNYESDEKFRESKLHAAAKRYKSDETFRSKTKAYNRNKYKCIATKIQKKEMNEKRRLARKVELEHQEEVVRVFKE